MICSLLDSLVLSPSSLFRPDDELLAPHFLPSHIPSIHVMLRFDRVSALRPKLSACQCTSRYNDEPRHFFSDGRSIPEDNSITVPEVVLMRYDNAFFAPPPSTLLYARWIPVKVRIVSLDISAILTSRAQIDRTLDTRIVVYDSLLIASIAFLTFVLLTAYFKRRTILRTSSWFSLIISWLIYAVSYLFIAGYHTGPEPPFGLCVFQAASVYTAPVV